MLARGSAAAPRQSSDGQTIEAIARALEGYLADHPSAVVLEDGKLLFDMCFSRYTLATEHGRCTLHLWGEDRNLVRRVGAAVERAGTLRLATYRFGRTKPQTLELVADRDRRTPSIRETTRVRYLRLLQRVLERRFPESRAESFRTAMDIEKSFGPAYARGILTKGTSAWAVIGVNQEESQATVDGILTLGILWLADCRERGGGRRLFQGLRLIVPAGMAAVTASRLAWLSQDAAQWELLELNEQEEELVERDVADHGNLSTGLHHAPSESQTRERFAQAAVKVMALVPEAMRAVVEQRVDSAAEMVFRLHGLEFARIRTGYTGESFNRLEEISFGAGANETPLTDENTSEIRDRVAKLFERRVAGGGQRDPLYRMQPERWLESLLIRDVTVIDACLDPDHVYSQVAAIAAGDRGMLDLLGVTRDGRLAVLELKADEDMHLALQGLDYWIRVRAHHAENPDRMTGLGEFQRHGYFGGIRLAEGPPRLYLVAPALRVHPATDTVLKYLSSRVEWTLVALGERWRSEVKVIWRKRSTDRTSG